ncbi:MAG: hypothetical protein GWP41_07815 [Planctomycetia bacterium]|nr:hypothetical protein [Planctomycetia bacterium]
MSVHLLAIFFMLISSPTGAIEDDPVTDKAVRPLTSILVFSKTAGFRHGSIESGQAAFRGLGKKYGFAVEVTEDANQFSEAQLRKHQVIVFLNSTQDLLDGNQQKGFEGYLRSGGGYVGIHAASDAEYDWPFYADVVGAYFVDHPAIQSAKINITDHDHPATSFLPKVWERTDEWFNYNRVPQHVQVLAWLDTDSYQGSSMPGKHPAVWCHHVDLGRAFYTAGGHTDTSFQEPQFLHHLAGAIYWAAGHDDWKAPKSIDSEVKKKPTPQKIEKTGDSR